MVDASSSWLLDIKYPGDEKNWATLDVDAGLEGKGEVTISYGANNSGKRRDLTLIGTCGKKVSVWHFSQSNSPKESFPNDVRPSQVGNWLEMPAVSESDGLCFFSHRHTIRGSESRDWSFYYDIDNKVAHWVAYPLNRGLIGGNVGRTDAWGYDPIIPNKYQSNLSRSYNGRKWQRGHQLPSADRQIRKENEQTFYYTNMTPQNGQLNTGEWAGLEGRVRSWALKFDTLYVVTGCTMYNKLSEVTYDASGQRCPIPGGYFKALLGYSKGGTASNFTATTGGYTSIAFYFDNRPASDVMSHAMTVEQLENKTGIDFFVNLPSKIGETLAKKVESANDDFWKK